MAQIVGLGIKSASSASCVESVFQTRAARYRNICKTLTENPDRARIFAQSDNTKTTEKVLSWKSL